MGAEEKIPGKQGGYRQSFTPEATARVMGGPLPVGQTRASGEPSYAAPLGRPVTTAVSESFSLQRAMGTVLPFVQKMLPLLDGNIGTSLANLLSGHAQPSVPAPVVDLAPVESRLVEMKAHQLELGDQLLDQSEAIRKLEDQLELLRDATDRNTNEQQELMQDLKTVGGKVNSFAILALLLLGASVALNVILYLHLMRVLP